MWENLQDLLAHTDIISSVASYINYSYAPILKGMFWKENYFQVIKPLSFTAAWMENKKAASLMCPLSLFKYMLNGRIEMLQICSRS